MSFLKASKFATASFHMFTLAEHAASHGVLPTTSDVEIDPARNPTLANLMRHGMDLGFGGQRELFEEGLTSRGGLWSKVPGLGDLLQRQSDWPFKRYLPALKTKVGQVVFERNLSRYSKPTLSGPALSEPQIYELTAWQMNAAFGGQNWRLLGTNKTYLDASRLLFTSPDFTLSRMKVLAQALKPYNAEQRWFLGVQAAVLYTACRALCMLFDNGNPHFEPANALRVVHNGRSYGARFLVNDVEGFAHDMFGSDQGMNFVSGRIGPAPRILAESIWQRDLRSGARKDVVVPTSSAGLRAAEIALQDTAEWLVPMGFEGFLPEARGQGQSKLGQLALSQVGIGSRKYTAETQMYDAAANFNRASNNPAAQTYQKTRDAEARVEGQYRKLDNLLDAGDVDGARKEYEALKAEGHTEQGF